MKKYKAIIYDLDGTVLNTINMNMYPLIKIIKEAPSSYSLTYLTHLA